MQELVDSADPAGALCALARKADDMSATPFERYAGSVLRDAGALKLDGTSASSIMIRRSADGQVVRLITPTNPFGSQAGTQVLEDALNRLLGVTSALVEGVGARGQALGDPARARRRDLCERNGVAYPLWSDMERGAHVVLPALHPGEAADDAYFNEIDWRMLDTVANNAHAFFQVALLANRNQVIFGVKAPHCSEWDVRTRLAAILEGAEPPLRLSYRFDCDMSRGTATVHFGVPPQASFPAIAACADGVSRNGTIEDARTVYALRLAALVAASCFGAGRAVTQAFVIGKDPDGRTVVSCAFDRTRFVHETLPVIDTGAFAAPTMRFRPDKVARALSANRADYATSGQAPTVTGLLEATRINPWEDERLLPESLQHLFRAKRVRDIDTSHYLGDAARIIDEAKADSDEAPVAAIAQLESIVAVQEASLAPPADDPEAQPLFCEHALSRVAIALLDDDLAIAREAEEFLHFGEEDTGDPLTDVTYYRAPDALFHAHVGLADLYRKAGDVKAAETQADRCIAIAPTTPAGFALKADALAGQGRFKEAANVIRSGLRIAIAENDRAFLLHDLALLLWRMGRHREASAVHIYTASLSGVYGKKSSEFVRQLAGEANLRDYIRANMGDASDIVNQMNLPLVPARTRESLLAHAALGLANAHMPLAAAPYIELIARHFPTNRVISAASESIKHGLR